MAQVVRGQFNISKILLLYPVIKTGMIITKTLLFKYIENFTTKLGNFLDKKL